LITLFSVASTGGLPERRIDRASCWQGLGWAIFLVSVPVFVEAPLVRSCPSLALIMTVGWLGLSRIWRNSHSHRWWGSLWWGFSLCWLCGAVYWGWLRSEPIWHIPIEGMALPWAFWALSQDNYRVGAHFYLGSLTGTIVTDAYFYLNRLMETWTDIMQPHVTIDRVNLLLENAIDQIHTPWGIATGGMLTLVLLILSAVHIMQFKVANWVLSGALLGTILVDFLFYASSLAVLPN